MSRFLYENHRGSPTWTLLNVFGVLGVLIVLNVLNVLYVLNIPMDASLACWALFFSEIGVAGVVWMCLSTQICVCVFLCVCLFLCVCVFVCMYFVCVCLSVGRWVRYHLVCY